MIRYKPNISVCIPTCNQPKALDKSLMSFVNQDITGVEILIRDDSNSNESMSIVYKYNSLPIQYFKMEKEGIDIAVIWLISKSKGKYIWIFGDDQLENNSIRNLNKIINEYSPSLIYLNSYCIQNYDHSINSSSYIGKDKNFFLSLIKDQMGFCSALVMKSSEIMDSLCYTKQFVGTCWVTLFLSLSVLNKSNKLIFDSRLFFRSEYKPPGEVKWYDTYLVHCINYAKVLKYFQNHFDNKLIKKLIKLKYINSVKAVLSERGKGFSTGYATRNNKFFVTFKEFWYEFITYPILLVLLIPNFIIVIIYNLYKKIQNIK